ncbi:MAG: HAD family hydrolase [Candidatus Eremiobacteraeota bacterium]|nr:HAD family hydrolase [Candidatus Eremiobacteraeota bacterium]
MTLKAILFDVNGTLVDVLTDEGMEEIYRAIGHFLSYYGIRLHRHEVRSLYFSIMDEQRHAGGEQYPEFDAVAIFREIISRYETKRIKCLTAREHKYMALFLAQLYRGISRKRLELYPGVKEVLESLKERYPLAVVTDAQSAYAVPEMELAGIGGYFSPVIISGDYGYRKPDPRLFQHALSALKVKGGEALFVGNDIYRDIYGARQAEMKTVLFMTDHGDKEREGTEPDFVVRDFRELLEAVEILERGQGDWK